MKELFVHSVKHSSEYDYLVVVWWVAYLGFSIATSFSSSVIDAATEPSSFLAGSIALVVTHVLSIISVISIMCILEMVSRGQEEMIEHEM